MAFFVEYFSVLLLFKAFNLQIIKNIFSPEAIVC